MKIFSAFCLALAVAWAPDAKAIDDLYEKHSPESTNGFLPAQHPAYVKECGGCHFVYSAGMLPARSWARTMERLDKHFGESLGLPPQTRDEIGRYLAENAADRSPFAGSRILMESLPDSVTPARIQYVPRLRSRHRVIQEVIARNFRIKVKTLVNCDGCHQRAAEGDFGLRDLRVEGLTDLKLFRPSSYSEN
jgi:hypothetical protein